MAIEPPNISDLDRPYIPPAPPPPPDAPNWDLINNGNPDSNWQSKYTYVPGIGWVLKPGVQNNPLADYAGGVKNNPPETKKRFPRFWLVVIVIIVLYVLFR